MSKLYTVTMEYQYVIEVEDDEDPQDVAEEVFRDVKYDIDVYSVDIYAVEMKDIPSGWDHECFPYRADGKTDKRIGEILKETN